MSNDKQDEIIAALSEGMPPSLAAIVRRITKDDLLPAHRKVYDELEKSGGAGLLIYAIPDISSLKPSIAEPIADERKVIVVGESGVRWTEVDVLRSRPTLAELEDALKPIEDPMLLGIVESMAKASGIRTPRLFASSLPQDMPGAAGVTREGIEYIMFDQDTNRFEILGMLGHEVGHLAKGHLSIERAVARHNNPIVSQANEYEADGHAHELGYGRQQIAWLAKHRCENEHQQNDENNPEVESGRSHPTHIKRIQRLQQEQGAEVSSADLLSCPATSAKARPKNVAQIEGH